jgi:AcrR family transcriptional regulator
MVRHYKMRKRAEARDRTRERILQATMQLHDEQGVAPTTMADIAKRAKVGQATVSRHFATLSDLIQTCGMHVWVEMNPPVPENASSVFAGIETTRERLLKLIQELDAFYGRGAHRLRLAARDRDLLPELDGFLTTVEAGVEALVREALAKADQSERVVQLAIVLTSFPFWSGFDRLNLPPSERTKMKLSILECGMRAARLT